jgi:hypothetical protein
MTTDENGYQVSKRFLEGMESSKKYEKADPVVTEIQFIEGTQQYQTELGEKVMKYLSGGDAPIVVPIEVDVHDEGFEEIDDPLDKVQEGLDKAKANAKALQETMSSTADLFYSAGSAASAFGDDTLAATFNSMGAIAEMIMKLQALSAAEAVEGAAKIGFPQNIPAIFTAMATVMSVFSQIKNFAEGGIIPGQNFQDGIVARVSSGEMIMNQADQKKLYNQIHSGGSAGSSGMQRSIVTGEQIVLAVNNHFKRKGRGEVLK